jgi:anti-sigma factor RsiW
MINPLVRGELDQAEAMRINQHLQSCEKCAYEHRLAVLSLAALNAAASNEPLTAGTDFMRSLRARIERGPAEAQVDAFDDSWAAALLLTARQLLPAMAVVLLLIIGATLLWNQPARQSVAARQDTYEVPEPQPDDSLELGVALEERANAR